MRGPDGKILRPGQPTAGAAAQGANGIAKPGVATNAAGLISNNGNGAIAIAGVVLAPAELIGKVKLISDHGGGLVSDHGGGLISDAGGGLIGKTKYAVLQATGSLAGFKAASQQPLANQAVRVVTAAGEPVNAENGQPLVAVTDEQGRYHFSGTLPAQALLVEAVLPGDLGALRAIAPKDASAREQTNVELVSTLTAGYIMERYVRSQADPVKTLEKLPASVEAETRQKAEAALASSTAALPETLAPANVTALVDALRASNSAFDAQMETVKKLLVAAGLSDLGNGQRAVDVLFNKIDNLAVASDGALLFHEPDGACYRVTPTGTLERLTGAGDASAPEALDGKPALQGKLTDVRRMMVDGRGRPWILEDTGSAKRLWRIESNGNFRDAGRGLSDIRCFVPTTGDGFVCTRYGKWGDPVELWEAPDGDGAPTKITTFQGADLMVAGSATAMGRDASGKLYFGGLISPSIIPKAYRLDPANLGAGMTFLKGAPDPGVGAIGLDAGGRVYWADFGSKRAQVLLPDGTTAAVPGDVDLGFFSADAVVGGPNGSYYGVSGGSIYRLNASGRVLVAGKPGQGGAGGSGAIALQDPRGLAVSSDGAFDVLDDGAIMHVSADGQSSTLLAKGALKDGDAALTPRMIKRGPDGALYMIGSDPAGSLWTARPPLFKLKSGQAPALIYRPTNELTDYAVAPDGTIYLVETRHVDISNHPARLLKLAGDGTGTPLIPEGQGFGWQMNLGLDHQGKALIYGTRAGSDAKLWRWNGTGVDPLPAQALLPEAIDPQGRWIAGAANMGDPATMRRYDPAADAVEVLVGAGGRLLTGSGVDDGVDRPRYPGFDGQGNLFFVDQGHKQIKRVPANLL
jgi:hypothetical protein